MRAEAKVVVVSVWVWGDAADVFVMVVVVVRETDIDDELIALITSTWRLCINYKCLRFTATAKARTA